MEIGSTRMVFLIYKWAIKIPYLFDWRRFLHGLLGNMQEKRFSVYPEICPVVFYVKGGFLNLARRARELTDDEFKNLILDKCEKDINRYNGVVFVNDEEKCLTVEGKASSFGWVDGKIVIIDFGD